MDGRKRTYRKKNEMKKKDESKFATEAISHREKQRLPFYASLPGGHGITQADPAQQAEIIK